MLEAVSHVQEAQYTLVETQDVGVMIAFLFLLRLTSSILLLMRLNKTVQFLTIVLFVKLSRAHSLRQILGRLLAHYNLLGINEVLARVEIG